jgi:hypothetical protein
MLEIFLIIYIYIFSHLVSGQCLQNLVRTVTTKQMFLQFGEPDAFHFDSILTS